MNSTANETTAVLPDWVYYEQIVYSGIVALIGIPGNILIILVFTYSRERSTTDYMVFSMAASDLLGSFVCTTFNLLRNVRDIWSRIGTTWLCRLSEYFGMLTAASSMWLLSAIAIDRYMKTCRPHSLVLTVSRAKWMCVIICAVVSTVSGPAAVAVRFDPSSGACLVFEENEWTIALNTIIVGCCLSFLVTAVAYILVAFALFKRLNDKIRRKRATRHPATVLVGGKNSKCINKSCEQKSGDKLDSSEPTSSPRDVNQVFVVEKAQGMFGSSVSKQSKSECKTYKKAGIDEVLRQEHRRVNRTTVVMFLITAINISTFMLLMIGYFLAENGVPNPGLAIGYIIQASYMANYITNPLLYMTMSSKFRENVRKFFQKR
ncbi:probable G-protein coupled receptor No18 [Mercenaria mercenaria]|uniref:probable G-protein coupled receptor No18 n=1 Tax=Mercenaria mercenaria TaxID=6596 RepID=UPI00234ED106|nr:probable G-protein coupled receptor No18 [Mercenaria mercenaria]